MNTENFKEQYSVVSNSQNKFKKNAPTAEILLVDDDPGDVDLIIEILKRGKIEHRLTVVDDGVKAIDYLLKILKREDPDLKFPDFIILDLNLPKKDGRSILQWIKSHNRLKAIPVIVFTTSRADSDIHRCYFSGANSYITKPVDFADFSRAVSSLENFWMSTAQILTRTTDYNMVSQETIADQPLRILLVEKDPDDVFFCKEILSSDLGHDNSINHVDEMEAAKNLLKSESFDLIVLDLCIAGVTEVSLLEPIMQNAGNTPIVVLVGMNEEKKGFEAIRKGAQDFLSKDQLDRPSLVRVLRYAFERSRFQKLQRENTEQSLSKSKEKYERLESSVFKGIRLYKGDKLQNSKFSFEED